MESSPVLDLAVFQRDAVYFALLTMDNLIVGMGLFWGLLCGFAFGCGDLLTRLGVRNGTPFTGAIINSGTTLIFFAVIVSVEGVQAGALWPAMGWFLLTGVVAIGPGRLLFYYSIRRIGVSRASVLVIITPLISMLTAVALLGERPSWRVVLGAVIIVGGLLSVVTDRGGILIDSRAALLGLLPTLFLSLTPFFIRLGMQSLPDPSLGTLLSSVGALTLLLMLQKAVPREDRWGADRRGFLKFLGAGVCYSVAFYAYHAALGSEIVSFVASLAFTSPLFAILIARLLFQRLEQITWRLAVGGAVVFIGVVLISISKGG